MNPVPAVPARCPRTGIQHAWALPGGAVADRAPWAVFFLNGIGLDLEGFRDAVQALDLPWALAKYPYRHGLHVTLTVPGFEDAQERQDDRVFTMAEQGQRVAEFILGFLADHPAEQVVLYGFSYGSDLAVEVLGCLQGRWAPARVVLTEMNVHAHSCFITSRIAASYLAVGSPGLDPMRLAYKNFVTRVVKAHADGRLSATLMEGMAMYFRTIAAKNWLQLARSAEEACADPEARVARLLGLTVDHPDTRFDLIFSDLLDLRIFLRRRETWGGALGRIQVFDATANEHFHHMSRAGVLDNLCGSLREVKPGWSPGEPSPASLD